MTIQPVPLALLAPQVFASPSLSPLGPLTSLPSSAAGLKHQRILLLVTSVNSFTQRVLSYLQYLGFTQVSVQLAISDEAMIEAAEEWQPDFVLCPFLTKKLPPSIHNRWITLVVHPGPPGDAGPSSLDWVLLGDDGTTPSSTDLLPHLLSSLPHPAPQRSHWGTICFQATEDLDGGAVWAWEQYELPALGSVTKAQVYQGYHSPAAMNAVIHALIRVHALTAGAGLPKSEWMSATPRVEWQTRCASLGLAFLGGATHERPLLQSAKRRPDWKAHTAEDVLRVLAASDSQPGAMLHPLTGDAKASLFAYGAHVHKEVATVPAELYTSRGWETYGAVPDGTPLATRDGAVFFKTHQAAGCSAGVWITHGRVPRGKDKQIDPKVPMEEAIKMAGHGKVLDGVREWAQGVWEEKAGEWQEVFVRRVQEAKGDAMLVYWNFYNGAFTTDNCKTLLSALQWATDPARGNIKLLALMGGNYFSNGIALNTISHAASPGAETWANICAIDDIVSFLVSDTSSERPPFLKGVTPLCERGITTVACVRGNAAAGGVALATACDVVLASRGVVLNPSYRGMGLHGSELHSYSYLYRCGPIHAAEILRDMKPLSTSLAASYGLVDLELGTSSSSLPATEPIFISTLRSLLSAPSFSPIPCAPWCRPAPAAGRPLLDAMSAEKLYTYTSRTRAFPPLQHFRQEELSQMLLDSFHPVRSVRYNTRREKFIRKLKAGDTPARYMLHGRGGRGEKDEEDEEAFDDAPGWKRGEEWAWAGEEVPPSLSTSENLRIPLLYPSAAPAAAPTKEKSAGRLAAAPEMTERRPSKTPSSSSESDSPLPQTPDLAHVLDSPIFAAHSGPASTAASPSREAAQQGRKKSFGAKLRAAFGRKPSSGLGVGTIGEVPAGKDATSLNPLGRPLGKGEKETEWPCLVTGGEEWEGARRAGGPRAEEVA
ncbi:hypothetical protein IAT38_001623 [Cryptococcus sp. DSM 104549]